MFEGFMVGAWVGGGVVAVIAGLVGFFVVLRSSAFAAHAIPNGAFAGAAAAGLAGASTLLGLGVFALLGAAGIALLGQRGRRDVATALVLAFMLGLGALLLGLTVQYAPELYSLLFGEVLGISSSQLVPTIALGAACAAAIALLYRPLMLSSVLGEASQARGVSGLRVELAFLGVVALVTTMTVPVVGTLLVFSLMIGPPAGARSLAGRPGRALALSVVLALATVWAAIALAYLTDYPVGFFVGTLSAAVYGAGRAGDALARGRRAQSAVAVSVSG